MPKKCGMSIQEMKSYLDLCLKGPSSIPQRKVMLAQNKNCSASQSGNWRIVLPISTGNRISMMRCSLGSVLM